MGSKLKCVGSVQVYEGEWVNNAPKCGELKAAPPGSFPPEAAECGGSPGGNQGNPSGSSSLPLLRLLGPETVISEAVASVRRSRASEVSRRLHISPTFVLC